MIEVDAPEKDLSSKEKDLNGEKSSSKEKSPNSDDSGVLSLSEAPSHIK